MLVWDLSTAKITKKLSANSDVLGVALSPDGISVASCHADNSIAIWDVITNKPSLLMTKHTNFVNSIAFSPDNMHLISCSKDKTVRIWTVESGLLI